MRVGGTLAGAHVALEHVAATTDSLTEMSASDLLHAFLDFAAQGGFV